MLSSVNWEVFERQKTFVIFLIIFVSSSFFLLEKINGSFKKEELLVDVNVTSREELLKVPYIGEKNVEEILKMRKEGKIESLEELEGIRFYKKFKYFLKTD